MDDQLLARLKRFHTDTFPRHRQRFEDLVAHGQHPTTLFIGCSDSRLVPYLLTGAGPGELFIVRNVGALVPPCCGTLQPSRPADDFTPAPPPRSDAGVHAAGAGAPRWTGGLHGTAAAIEFAVLNLHVEHIVVCGHSHCGAIKALYEDLSPEAVNLGAWLELAREAVLPVRPTPESLRRTEQRAIVLQLERLMDYPMVRRRVERGALALHGWHYVIEDGDVHVFDMKSGSFVPASRAEHSGDGPFPVNGDTALFNEIDDAFAPALPAG
ncbi:carbonic anhydrase [Aquabacterium humicola]|uniref:carbonic anhydrase n=1 Tax=Aquabacterium humicola TaxID=3237377 RepID=UPI0025433794|nr:carbonic anhydrase [Rubrivivax pictus]